MNETSDILIYKNIVQTLSGQFNYKKPQINADERRLITSDHRKGREERKAAQQEIE